MALMEIVGIGGTLIVETILTAQITVGGSWLYEQAELLANCVDWCSLPCHEYSPRSILDTVK
jgi:hypothetical protein